MVNVGNLYKTIPEVKNRFHGSKSSFERKKGEEEYDPNKIPNAKKYKSVGIWRIVYVRLCLVLFQTNQVCFIQRT